MRHTSWYICFHSAMGSTCTSTSVNRSAPSPAFTGAAADAITNCGPAAAAPSAATTAHAQQHLVAVGGEVERSYAVRQFLQLAGLQVISRKRGATTPGATAAGAFRS